MISNNTIGYNGTTGNAYNWTPIPSGINSEKCRIRVADNRSGSFPTVYNYSPLFSIRPRINVSAPALNNNVSAGSENITPIRWNYTGSSIGNVIIEYSTNNGLNWTNVSDTPVPVTNTTYVWPLVPALTSNTSFIRIYDVTIRT